jgi:hypothetical protein
MHPRCQASFHRPKIRLAWSGRIFLRAEKKRLLSRAIQNFTQNIRERVYDAEQHHVRRAGGQIPLVGNPARATKWPPRGRVVRSPGGSMGASRIANHLQYGNRYASSKPF